jgi:predicted phosphate transport protein (TIGR00153 family)
MKRSGSLGIWLGKEKEKEILKLCAEHFERIIETVEGMRNSVIAFHEGDVPRAIKLAKDSSNSEKGADDIKKKILDDLGKGMFHPIDRDEILRLVLEVDGIASNAKASVGKLVMIPREMMPGSLTGKLVEMVEKLVSTVKLMGKAFTALIDGSIDVFDLCQEVENFEEEIDDFRKDLIREHFLPWCQEPNRAGLCIILKEAIDNMENVADQAEDVADVIRSIAILSK